MLSSHEEAANWLALGLILARVPREEGGARSGNSVRQDSPRQEPLIPRWVDSLAGERGGLPPLPIVVDFGRILEGGSLHKRLPMPSGSQRVQRALRQYEDHVLSRLLSSTGIEGIRDEYSGLSAELRGQAATILLQRVLGRAGFTQDAYVPTRAVQECQRMLDEELRGKGQELVGSDESLTDALVASLELLTEKVRRAPVLLREDDAFLVKHVDVLGKLGQRVLIEQLEDVREAFRVGLPTRMRPKKKNRQARVATQLADEQHYPAGGFSSISNSGSLENIVISELIYMEDAMDKGDADKVAGVDLFDLRYAEGELLYYTRDDAVFQRDFRVIQFVFDDSLDRCRTKDSGIEWQRLVVALGLTLCATEKLCDWLGDTSGLSILFSYVGKGGGSETGQESLREELDAMGLLLKELEERGIVSFTSHATQEEALEDALQRSQGAPIDQVYLSRTRSNLLGSRPSGKLPKGVALFQLGTKGPRPTLEGAGLAATEGDSGIERELWSEWQAVARTLLQELL